MPIKFTAKTLTLDDTIKSQLQEEEISGVQLKADKNNVGIVFVGRSNVNNVDGYRLHPGEMTYIPADKSVVTILFFIAENTGDKISYFTV